ncbi:hypothetical protein BDV32DRAFT_115789 [Aspergillus pseudonomiae]|uniref:Uncharacterized protein n=1 Tax=Aspergillus pseudonomiae TaxID=1506151 RepID=A0A5N7DH71_9EURO|nr:uncharacterized protein BDV37DRAFT_244653 [Aspergillus pseudonomiae]KAB8265735.1 hypothetical protein BDV32DRAFT_115789 [Aspergillus pseudonomiae]KAE8405782.1 hypothetical protein BDV37DRAFT_244653 [Aspergillus pseudonomiae]
MAVLEKGFPLVFYNPKPIRWGRMTPETSWLPEKRKSKLRIVFGNQVIGWFQHFFVIVVSFGQIKNRVQLRHPSSPSFLSLDCI